MNINYLTKIGIMTLFIDAIKLLNGSILSTVCGFIFLASYASYAFL